MPSAELSDAHLVARARAGSDAAFAQLVDRHQQALRSFLRKLCAHTDEADDLAQEAFLEAWQSLPKLQSDTKFATWLMGIAWRKTKMRARSASRDRARDTAWSELQSQTPSQDAELSAALHQALAQLSAEQRAATALCLGAGWSHPEAAEALNMPLGTLKSHVTRGRAKLAEILEVQDD